MSLDLIATAISQLGVGGIFVYLYLRKDNQQKEMTDKVLEAFKENTKVQEGVRGSIVNNTKAIEGLNDLTQKVYEELIKR